MKFTASRRRVPGTAGPATRKRWFPDWIARSAMADRVVLAVALCVLALVLSWTRALSHVDEQIYDAFLATMDHPASDDVVIVAIDSPSLEALGRWPWPRAMHAAMVRRLAAAGARATGFDVAFAEPGAALDDDDLAGALSENGRVVLPVLPDRTDLGGGVRDSVPIAALAKAAAALGHVDLELDSDTVSRRVYLRAGSGTPRWPAFAAAVLDTGTAAPAPAFPGARRVEDGGTPGRWVRDFEILVPFAGPPGRYRQVSYVDVLRDDAVARGLSGKFVFVGATAVGLGPRVATPVSHRSQAMTGAEFHANVLDGLRRGTTITQAPVFAEIAACAAVVLASLLLYRRGRPVRNVAWLAGMAVALLLAAWLLLWFAHSWMRPGLALALLLVAYPVWLWRRLERTAHGLAVAREHSRAALQSVTDAVISVDAEHRVTQINPAAELLLGISADEATGRDLESVMVPAGDHDRAVARDTLSESQRSATTQHAAETIEIKTRKGRGTVHIAASPIVGRDLQPGAMVIALTDAREEIALSERAAYLATFDPITALPNEYLLADRLQLAIAACRREGEVLAVLCVGIDAPKDVVVESGPAVGDLVAEEVARRLHEARRASDSVARWRPDVFAMVLPRMRHPERAAIIANHVLERLSVPVRAGHRDVHIAARIGIAVYPGDGFDVESVLAAAEAAMNRAARDPQGSFRFYSADFDAPARQLTDTERRLRGALREDHFEMEYQPQIALDKGGLCAVEALLRWRHPDRGLLRPPMFMRDLENSLIDAQVDAWAVSAACAQARTWRESGLGDLTVAVNVSASRFARDDFAAVLRRMVLESGVDPRAISVEIPEGVLNDDHEHAFRALSALRDAGMQVAVNDFGQAYGAVALLKRLPINQIKFVAATIQACVADPRDAAVIHAAVEAARRFGIVTSAVGIESRMQLELLKQLQFDRAQGYYFGAPMNAEVFYRRAIAGRSKWLASELVPLRSNPSSPGGQPVPKVPGANDVAT